MHSYQPERFACKKEFRRRSVLLLIDVTCVTLKTYEVTGHYILKVNKMEDMACNMHVKYRISCPTGA
jgi:hypothetical protein